jgi:hypothetical protein
MFLAELFFPFTCGTPYSEEKSLFVLGFCRDQFTMAAIGAIDFSGMEIFLVRAILFININDRLCCI